MVAKVNINSNIVVEYFKPKTKIMSKTPRTPFGKKISKDEANRYFKNYVKIKGRTNEKVSRSITEDYEAKRFYCGEMGQDQTTDDLCFVFDKASIQQIIDKLNNNTSDGVVIFKGSRNSEDSVDDTGNEIDVDGRPTLMIFPYKYVEANTAESTDTSIEVGLDDGSEHPGTGNGNGFVVESIIRSSNSKDSLPTLLPLGAIHKMI